MPFIPDARAARAAALAEIERQKRLAHQMSVAELIVALREPQRKLVVLLNNRAQSLQADIDLEDNIEELVETGQIDWGLF